MHRVNGGGRNYCDVKNETGEEQGEGPPRARQ